MPPSSAERGTGECLVTVWPGRRSLARFTLIIANRGDLAGLAVTLRRRL